MFDLPKHWWIIGDERGDQRLQAEMQSHLPPSLPASLAVKNQHLPVLPKFDLSCLFDVITIWMNHESVWYKSHSPPPTHYLRLLLLHSKLYFYITIPIAWCPASARFIPRLFVWLIMACFRLGFFSIGNGSHLPFCKRSCRRNKFVL